MLEAVNDVVLVVGCSWGMLPGLFLSPRGCVYATVSNGFRVGSVQFWGRNSIVFVIRIIELLGDMAKAVCAYHAGA